MRDVRFYLAAAKRQQSQGKPRLCKQNVPAIPEWWTPKLDEINDVSSFGDVFQCYRWRQLYVINPPYEFSIAVPKTTASLAAWTRGGGKLRLSGATRPIAAMDFRRSKAGSTSCLSFGRGGKTGLESSQWLCSSCGTP